MKNHFIFVRGLRHVDHTVFVVEKEQKTYRDPSFGYEVAYSSGQQIKRSIINSFSAILNEKLAPVTFYWEAPKLDEAEVLTPGDPSFADQLIGGWMIAKSKKSGEQQATIKRRSPLSISAMRPLHPLLGKVYKENLTFDRREQANFNEIIVRDSKGNILSKKEVDDLLSNTARSLNIKFIQDKKRTSGLFIYDIAIDLRTLFCISTNQLEPELSQEMIDKLKSDGWSESKNIFGPCLLAPKERREEIIQALGKALLNWRITTNQSRTFSLMETLAVAISDNANKIAGSIRAKLSEDTEKQRAIPVIDDTAGADIFIALSCDGYIAGVHGTGNALEDAENKLKSMMFSFDYENQLT